MEPMLYIPLNRIVHLRGYKNIGIVIFVYFHIWVISYVMVSSLHPYYHLLSLIKINTVAISYKVER